MNPNPCLWLSKYYAGKSNQSIYGLRGTRIRRQFGTPECLPVFNRSCLHYRIRSEVKLRVQRVGAPTEAASGGVPRMLRSAHCSRLRSADVAADSVARPAAG